MISEEGVKDYMSSITHFEPRDYQVNAVYDALRYNRKLLISPTGSGKSFMIYTITEKDYNKFRELLDKETSTDEN